MHQTDFVGPCFLRGAVRFYSLHSVDVATGRCGVQRLANRSSQPTVDALWAIWSRLGIPAHQQVDNEMVFYGSRAHPRGLGPLIRLCLAMQVEPWFIPPAEPWRNGVVEKFNDRWQQFGPLRRTLRTPWPPSIAPTVRFEDRHNAHYRYSKLGGRTPNAVLAASRGPVAISRPADAPRSTRCPSPRTGDITSFASSGSDGRIDLFGEPLRVPPEAVYTYVRATDRRGTANG